MSTHVLIVEGDGALSARMRGALEARGFSVQETTDGRTCVEVARQGQAACVVLAVDLPSGQNGYILCGKFKKDDELRAIPVAIVGSPEGFGQHGKLKNRADAYLAKPLQLDEFAERIIELTGHAPIAVVPARTRMPPAPQPLDLDEATVSGDPDLDLIDAAFDTSPLALPRTAKEAELNSPPSGADPVEFEGALARAPKAQASFPDDEFEDSPELTFTPASALSDSIEQPSMDTYAPEGEDGLRREVARLQAALEDAQARSFSSDVRIHQLEAELEGRAATNDEQDRRRVDQSVERAEAATRDANEQLADLQAAIAAASARADAAEQEANDLRTRAEAAEEARDQADGELTAARRDRELNRAHADGAQRQLAALQSTLEQGQSDLAAAREELAHRDASREDELGALQQRCREFETLARKHEERVARLYARLKSEERAREKAARAVAMAGQLLSQSGPAAPAPETPSGDDEPAAA
jgi:DNA-binding response OmpR family regulator/predicted  nucleic acid-binding Zn-ribbon protein